MDFIWNKKIYAREDIVNAASKVDSINKLISELGLNHSSKSHRALRQYVEQEGIFITPFVSPKRIPDELVFVKDSPYVNNRVNVKQRYLAMGYPNVCECGQGPEWNGKILVLQLDHINGKNDDHRIENLRILCPNCHTQTPTYAGRRR